MASGRPETENSPSSSFVTPSTRRPSMVSLGGGLVTLNGQPEVVLRCGHLRSSSLNPRWFESTERSESPVPTEVFGRVNTVGHTPGQMTTRSGLRTRTVRRLPSQEITIMCASCRRGRTAGYPTAPHRSRRAALPHRAPASGGNAQAPAGACRMQSSTCDRETPALRPVPGMLDHVPLGPLPSLHLLRRSPGATLVRRLPRYYEAVRLPASVHHGRIPWVPRADLAIQHQARCRASRVPRRVFLCMPEVSDPARCVYALP